MDVVLLSIIIASGLCAARSDVVRRFHFVYEPKKMSDAQSYCREKYTDLATVRSEEDVKLLNQMANLSQIVNTNDSNIAWIGLYEDTNTYRWSFSDTSFYNERETEFRNWYDGEPNNYYSEACAIMYTYGTWNDVNCTKKYQPVCMDVQGHNAKFDLIPYAMSWTVAQNYCREHHTDLASVRNMEDNNKINKLMSGASVWIGLSRETWKWLDGSDSPFRYWREGGEPYQKKKTHACVVANLTNSGRWEDWSCDFKTAFICYSDVEFSDSKVIKVRLVKQDTSLDLNDPAVMENILKQLEQQLKDQGVTEHFKLSWRKQPDGKVFHKEKEEEKKKTKKEREKEFCQIP